MTATQIMTEAAKIKVELEPMIAAKFATTESAAIHMRVAGESCPKRAYDVLLSRMVKVEMRSRFGIWL